VILDFALNEFAVAEPKRGDQEFPPPLVDEFDVDEFG